MLILGWHGNPRTIETEDRESFAYHDAAAALLEDGRVVAAIEEERLSRVKHTNVFPTRAISFCLEQARATLQDVDFVVTDLAEEVFDYVATRDFAFNARLPIQTGRQIIAGAFERNFGQDVSRKIRFCKHHSAHVASAWHPSGFDEALIVTLDGFGDGSSGVIAQCAGENVRILRQIPESMSLGNFYLHNLFFLGYHRFDEYKAMGLAPYGNASVFGDFFNQMYRLEPEGRYRLQPLHECFLLARQAGLMQRARRKGSAFTQEHKNFAAGLQAALETIVNHLVDYFKQETKARRLCLSGGVAHNCSMNGILLRSGRFEEMYVQPAAHDAGNAVGAALAVHRELGLPRRRDAMPHVFLGPDIGSSEHIGQRLKAWRPLIEFGRLDDIALSCAQMIADGNVIGWVQGRSEFGPRALGNRSIVADPRRAENKEIINAMVKKRESYRPFAPAVLEERLHEYFDLPGTTRALPFMVIVTPVKPQYRQLLAAVTHVDGSARVQSVSAESNPRFHRLIEAFGGISGVPVLLNTSFNNNAEPIVDSIDDAVTAFLTTDLSALVIGDWLIRRGAQPLEVAIRSLVPKLTPSYKLVRRGDRSRTCPSAIESAAVNPSSPEPAEAISKPLFQVLSDDSDATLYTRLTQLGITDEETMTRHCKEILELWSSRKVRLVPEGV